ncbi:MAG TPA: hypothetical protein VFG28_08630 [Syntrophales bacterium]|nr:hypothetical protein [Syntrophales bacterium]
MANVFIYPVDDEAARTHFGIAAGKRHALESVLPLISDDAQAETLTRLYPDGECYVWGVHEKGGNLSVWNVMAQDDLVLGYRNRSIVCASTVLMKVRNPALATRLWGGHAEGPFELMCFSDKPHVGEVPIVEQMLGYLDQEFSGFTMLSLEKCQTILNAFGSLDIFVRLGLRYDFPFNFRHSE